MRKHVRLLAVLTTVTLLSSCGLLGDSSEPAASGSADGPELQTLHIGAVPVPDVAPVRLAIERGYFETEGLHVTLRDLSTCASGQDCVDKIVTGSVQIAMPSWTPALLAIAKGVADLRFVADGVTLTPGNSLIMVDPAKGIRNLRDLAGKRVAVSAFGTAAHLLTASALQVEGVDLGGIQWVTVPFPLTAAAIMSGHVDAGFLVEPYVQMARRAGALDIHDTNLGPTHDLPLSGYVALGATVTKYPRTIAAFQRALRRAVVDLQGDRVLLQHTLAQYLSITTYPTQAGKEPVKAGPEEVDDVLSMAVFNHFRPDGNVTAEGLGRVQSLMLAIPQGGLTAEIPNLASRIVPYAK